MSSRRRALEWPFPRHRNFERDMRTVAAQWFASKGFTTHPRMPYCLEKWDHWEKNIILPEVTDYIRGEKTKKGDCFPLHKYLHHGLSSQALAFNLLGPLIVLDDLPPLTRLLEARGIRNTGEIASASFEFDDRMVFNEDSGQPTSIDVVLKTSDNEPRIFVECKFTEHEFGGCSVLESGDCSGKNPLPDKNECYLHFIGRRYWTLMEKHGFDRSLESEKQCVFAMYYQYFREVLFALEKGGVFVLLSDARSPVFHETANGAVRGLMPFLQGFTPSQYRHRVQSITIQELLKSAKESGRHPEWIPEFERKYGMNGPGIGEH